MLTGTGGKDTQVKIADGVVIKVDKSYVFKDMSSTPIQQK